MIGGSANDNGNSLEPGLLAVMYLASISVGHLAHRLVAMCRHFSDEPGGSTCMLNHTQRDGLIRPKLAESRC